MRQTGSGRSTSPSSISRVIIGVTVLAGLLAQPLPGRCACVDLRPRSRRLPVVVLARLELRAVASRGHQPGAREMGARGHRHRSARSRRRGGIAGWCSPCSALAFMAYGFFGWLAPGIFEAAYLSPGALHSLPLQRLQRRAGPGAARRRDPDPGLHRLRRGAERGRRQRASDRPRDGGHGPPPRRTGQGRDPGLVAFRHAVGLDRRQRHVDRRGHHPDDEEVRLSRPATPRRSRRWPRMAARSRRR